MRRGRVGEEARGAPFGDTAYPPPGSRPRCSALHPLPQIGADPVPPPWFCPNPSVAIPICAARRPAVPAGAATYSSPSLAREEEGIESDAFSFLFLRRASRWEEGSHKSKNLHRSKKKNTRRRKRES